MHRWEICSRHRLLDAGCGSRSEVPDPGDRATLDVRGVGSLSSVYSSTSEKRKSKLDIVDARTARGRCALENQLPQFDGRGAAAAM